MENLHPVTLNLFERFNRWIQESIMVKLFSIGFLTIILLIPTTSIDDLIYERQNRADQVLYEVTDKWSGPQKVSGPILIIPFKVHEMIDQTEYEKIEKSYFLPENLNVNGNVTPEILHRGSFDAVVYHSTLKINASFAKPDFQSLSIDDQDVLWEDAYMVFGITDLRGISDNPDFVSGGKNLTAEPSNNIGITIRKERAENAPYDTQTALSTPSTNGIITKLNWENAESFQSDLSVSVNLKGSGRLDFVPVGKTTKVTLNGTWNNPSFDGQFLPAKRNITDSNFAATWNVLHFNRPFSQQWRQSNQELSGGDFGVNLLIPVDQYQKSVRTAKYRVLIVLLTFVALFLVEITQKIRIHPFQYILIGAALIIYYTLLLSFSEHIGYNLAYIIASVATVLLIGLYSTTFFTKRLALVFSTLIVIFYAFIYIIILQQDFSLLLGSIGLFIIIGTLMYFSRKVKWYKDPGMKSNIGQAHL